MIVRATRTSPLWTLRALFYVALIAFISLSSLALTAIFVMRGWSDAFAVIATGVVALALFIVGHSGVEMLRRRWQIDLERERAARRLPIGPCCVVWREEEKSVRQLLEEEESGVFEMPWAPIAPLRPRYPRLARRLGIEGVAVAEFEIGADGRAKMIACADVWPSDIFFEAAREALQRARFQPRGDVHVRYGVSYKLPFVFRIAGAGIPRGVAAKR